MMKFIESINSAIKLVTALAMLALLLGFVGGIVFVGLWCYGKVAQFTATPIQIPTIKVEAPGLGIVSGLKKLDQDLGEMVNKTPELPPIPPPPPAGYYDPYIRKTCDHTPLCRGTTDHNGLVLLERCPHSPRCRSSSACIDRRISEMWAKCTHNPKFDTQEFYWQPYMSDLYNQGLIQ